MGKSEKNFFKQIFFFFKKKKKKKKNSLKWVTLKVKTY